MTDNKFIATLTRFNNIDVSIGTIISLKPFFVNYATEKEMVLCLCKICLNTIILLKAAMKEEKKQYGVPFSFVSKFVMTDCECEQSPSGYFSWSCVTGNCKQCQSNQYPLLSGEKTNSLVIFSQFELTNTPYQQKDKQGNITKKIAKKTKRVHHLLLFNECVSKLKSIKYSYLMHRYQVNNDIYHWPQILGSIETIGLTYHMDFQRTFPNSLNMNHSHLISIKNNTLYIALLCMIKKQINTSTTYQIILNIILLSLSVLQIILQALVLRHLLFVLKVITAVPNTNVNKCLGNVLN